MKKRIFLITLPLFAILTTSAQCRVKITASDTVCRPGFPVTLIATGGSNYYWFPATGLNKTTGDTVIATPTVTTQYQVTSAGCSLLFVTGGENHSLGIQSDSSLWSWGYNGYGKFGNGTTTPSLYPVKANDGGKWKVLGCGRDHSAGIRTDGTLWTWGGNDQGTLGDSSTVSSYIPKKLNIPGKWKSISVGFSHTLALNTDGTIWAWGANTYGQIGDSTKTNRSYPVRIGKDSDWEMIAAGNFHSMALKKNGTLWTWGRNSNGELGNGSTDDVIFPAQIGSAKWVDISSGDFHCLGIQEDSTLWGWGRNSWGQAGVGNTNTRILTPERAGTKKDWKSTNGGASYSHALDHNNKLFGWGYNGYGAIGNGTRTHESNPVLVDTNAEYNFIKSGFGEHFSGIKTDGSFWAWGRNQQGQCGDSTYNTSDLPKRIQGGGINSATVTIRYDAAGSIHRGSMAYIAVYPNPFSGIIRFQVPEKLLHSTLEIRTPSGKRLYSAPVRAVTFSLDLTDFPAGVYFIQLGNQQYPVVKID
ncbi:MAG: T9SS type A sorting domain-containing protein [Bacteroidetes bacterium]|nr:T9SS type A sorting domain-containing protein [Bacteroidota bacterium]